MSILKFQEKEAKVILHALDLRIHSSQVDKYEIEKTQEIISNFTRFAAFEGYNLKEKDRSWTLGCIQTGFIDPNIDLINMSDYEVLTSDASTIQKIEELIEIIKLRNKLLLKKDLKDSFYKKYKEFLVRLDNISKFKNIHKIHYSELKRGSLYKLAISLDDGNGIRYDNFGEKKSNFNFEKINQSEYLSSMEPRVFIEKYAKYSNETIEQLKVIVDKFYE